MAPCDAQADIPPDYELLDQLGKGGMGLVYTARQTSLDRVIALKIMNPAKAIQDGAHDTFLSEAVVTGDLEHLNIIPVHELVVNEQDRLFYTMKRIEGRCWRETIGLQEDLDILLKVADAVSFAHSRGVMHRDLKPANVMPGEYGEVFVTDWGLAADLNGKSKADRLTIEPQLCGTPLYMAQEMARGDIRAIGAHSDIYLLGAMLYQIVSGHPPRRRHADFWECIVGATRNIIEPTDKKGELLDIALKAMAMEPRDRYPTGKAFQKAIQEYRNHNASIALACEAAHQLEEAPLHKDQMLLTEAIAGFRHALKLWPENERALEGLDSALLKQQPEIFKRP